MSAVDHEVRRTDRRGSGPGEITVMVLPDAAVGCDVRVRTSRMGVVEDIRLVEGTVAADLCGADLLLGGADSWQAIRGRSRGGQSAPPFLLVAEPAVVAELPRIDAGGAAAVLASPLDIVELAAVAHGVVGSGPFLSLRLSQLAVEPQGETLSVREAEVVAALGEGLSDAEIAEALCISVKTVNTHVLNLRRKLGAKNRAHAVALDRNVRPVGVVDAQPDLADAR